MLRFSRLSLRSWVVSQQLRGRGERSLGGLACDSHSSIVEGPGRLRPLAEARASLSTGPGRDSASDRIVREAVRLGEPESLRLRDWDSPTAAPPARDSEKLPGELRTRVKLLTGIYINNMK